MTWQVDEFYPIDPARPVLVRHDDGGWYTGIQDGWVQGPKGLIHAVVRYTVASDDHERPLPAARVRPIDGSR